MALMHVGWRRRHLNDCCMAGHVWVCEVGEHVVVDPDIRVPIIALGQKIQCGQDVHRLRGLGRVELLRQAIPVPRQQVWPVETCSMCVLKQEVLQTLELTCREFWTSKPKLTDFPDEVVVDGRVLKGRTTENEPCEKVVAVVGMREGSSQLACLEGTGPSVELEPVVSVEEKQPVCPL